jgi:hypothetical protein
MTLYCVDRAAYETAQPTLFDASCFKTLGQYFFNDMLLGIWDNPMRIEGEYIAADL